MKRWTHTHTQRPSSVAAPSASTALYKASAPSTMAPSSSATGSSNSSSNNNSNNNAASTTDDVAGMLDFGNSVVVTEDMRRSVQAETEVVVQAIQKLTNSHKAEQATGARLLQDLRHAHKELLSQERTTKDKRDSAGIHAECRKQLSETLKTRLIDPLAVALPAHTLQQLFPDSADAATDDVDTVANKDKNGSSVTTTKQKKKSSNPAYLDQAKQKVLHLGNHLQESQTILEQRKASIARKQKATRALQHSIQERNLEATLQAGRRDTATKRREEQSGADKVRSVQEIIQQLRDKGGESAQKITKLVSTFIHTYITLCCTIFRMLCGASGGMMIEMLVSFLLSVIVAVIALMHLWYILTLQFSHTMKSTVSFYFFHTDLDYCTCQPQEGKCCQGKRAPHQGQGTAGSVRGHQGEQYRRAPTG